MKKSITTLVLLGGLMLGLTIADLCTPDRVFSAYENRVLASKPAFSFQALFTGHFTGDYETYVTDQFTGRDKWISIKTMTDVFLGKKEVNGVYLATDGSLIEKHAPEDVEKETEEKRLALLQKLADRQKEKPGNFWVMLVPTADNILTDKLPAYAAYYNQKEFLDKVTEMIGEDSAINVWDILNTHKGEYIYYKTDHHWTTLGAYYGYLAWAEKSDMTNVSYNAETVSRDFLGTLHSKTNLSVAPDTIEAYKPTWQQADSSNLQVYYDLGTVLHDALYEESYLSTKNQYGYFLDDNHPFIEIHRDNAGEAAGKTLFIIRDSYASCLIPFLTEHYETIYVLDLRYYNSRLFPLLEQYEAQGEMDVLVLYNVIHFLEEFQYY